MTLKPGDAGGDKFTLGALEFFVVDLGMSALFLGSNGDKVTLVTAKRSVFAT